MKQPELGKKIAELRKVKGLTQEELVETCNLSVRTLQRIESGEVSPRSYTIKVIFSALDYSFSELIIPEKDKSVNSGTNFSIWLEQVYLYVFDLFNLKTNTMKKVSILSVSLLLIVTSLLVFNTESKGQSSEKLRLTFENNQKKILACIEKGKIDSAIVFYSDDACLFPSSYGKDAIKGYFTFVTENDYELLEYHTLSVSVCDDLAIEKYSIVCKFQGVILKQKGMSEWQNRKGKWLIVNDVFVNE
jgi:transcriptional regulator with XRE-family HTH domain/ketosteroid isomerase-like protein